MPAVTDISVGETVQVLYGKWGGGRHYEFTMSRLGEDEHGVWLGAPPRTTIWRPGATFPSSTEWVRCFARAAGWTASFYPREEHDMAAYVDITTPPSWSRDDERGSDVVAMVDLDLDVVLRVNGELLIDDEDEFEEHRQSLGYPKDDRRGGRVDNRSSVRFDRRGRRAVPQRRAGVAGGLCQRHQHGSMRSRTVRTNVSGSNGLVT